MFKNHLLLS